MTRLLNLLGVDLSDNLLPSKPDNPKGFFEHKDIVETHNQFIREIGSYWDDIRPLPKNCWVGDAADNFHQKVLRILKRDFADSKLWALKDPRMSKLLKLWPSLFSEMRSKPHFIIVFRNPLEVSSSLHESVGMPRAKSMMLWLIRTLESEIDTRGYPRIFVSFEHLVGNWRTTMESISETLKIQWPKGYDEVEGAVADFIDSNLRHHRLSEKELEEDHTIPNCISSLYGALRVAEKHDDVLVRNTFSSIAENIQEEIKRFTPSALIEDLNAREKIFRNLTERLSQTSAELARREKDLSRILNSWSWKIMAPLRYCYRMLRCLHFKTRESVD